MASLLGSGLIMSVMFYITSAKPAQSVRSMDLRMPGVQPQIVSSSVLT